MAKDRVMRMQSRLLVPLALLASSALSGCVAVAIPVLAGGAMLTRGGLLEPEAAPSEPQSAAPGAAPAAPAPAPAPENASPTASVPTPDAMPSPVAGAPAIPNLPLAALQLTTFDPAFAGFASFAVQAAASAKVATTEAPVLSALLADPVALDGERAPCEPDAQPAVVIDLDPADASFAPSATPAKPMPEHAAALAEMRAAGIAVAWISQSPVTQTGVIRTALEQAGLDPRGQDVLMLASNDDDRKQVLREALAANSCILAIAGDERFDFDERFRYLRNPAAGAGLEMLIGNTWFIVRNIFPAPSSTGPSTP